MFAAMRSKLCGSLLFLLCFFSLSCGVISNQEGSVSDTAENQQEETEANTLTENDSTAQIIEEETTSSEKETMETETVVIDQEALTETIELAYRELVLRYLGDYDALFADYRGERIEVVPLFEDGIVNFYSAVYYKASAEESIPQIVHAMFSGLLDAMMIDDCNRGYEISSYQLDDQIIYAYEAAHQMVTDEALLHMENAINNHYDFEVTAEDAVMHAGLFSINKEYAAVIGEGMYSVQGILGTHSIVETGPPAPGEFPASDLIECYGVDGVLPLMYGEGAFKRSYVLLEHNGVWRLQDYKAISGRCIKFE